MLLQLRDFALNWVFGQQRQVVRIQPLIGLEQLQAVGHGPNKVDSDAERRRDFLIRVVRVELPYARLLFRRGASAPSVTLL